MCGFVGDCVDVKKLSADEKQKLEAKLQERKKYLEGRIKELDRAISKLGGKAGAKRPKRRKTAA